MYVVSMFLVIETSEEEPEVKTFGGNHDSKGGPSEGGASKGSATSNDGGRKSF